MQQHADTRLKLQLTAQSPTIIFGERSQKAKLTLSALDSVEPGMTKEFPSHHAVPTRRVRAQRNGFWSNEHGGVRGE